MKSFISNIVLALIWAAMSGEMTLGNLTLGFIIGYIILYLMQRISGPSRYYNKVWHVMRFLVFFIKEMLSAGFRVAWDVLTPKHYNRPGIIAYPLEPMSSLEITLLAKVISLTPGTLSLDVSPDERILYIHAMFIDDADQLRRDIKDRLERPLLEVLR
jgi:multicomponent Na+:H+ antiporter subunit E